MRESGRLTRHHTHSIETNATANRDTYQRQQKQSKRRTALWTVFDEITETATHNQRVKRQRESPQ
ncbi:hypothetical protein SAMN05443661_102180 [Natronobacterium gregoryi]|uniref:Uncharacterized protein n=2 Tax=Natronobacterium gregoryi TaxID=44930 RepID=L0AJ55_NATGS|nr:hypothetical protein Natgr_1901 [Natronobacterium gregoryi SP2]SFI61485.1 hypothetical protein SAMN05443661_102180 [Natronobacterium gregoryi]